MQELSGVEDQVQKVQQELSRPGTQGVFFFFIGWGGEGGGLGFLTPKP